MKYCFILLIPIQLALSQSPYPQDYFMNPLDITTVLSGTFGELRNNHFHSGLDIKTQQVEGMKVYAVADGYVSRIKIAHYGYGKALYVTHPNGYVSVYAHLQKLAPKLETYLKTIQYERGTYEIELFPQADELLVNQGDIIAFSGNTGSSGGPHLHFEIRDNLERPINPLLFGIDVKDTKPPTIQKLYAYPKDVNSFINGKNERTELRLIPRGNASFEVEPLTAYGAIGFGISTYDQQDLAANKNGVSNITTTVNGIKNFEIDFKRFSFDETSHLNRLVDYEFYKTKRSFIKKLFVEPNNPLTMFKDVIDDGYIKVEDSINSIYKIDVSDFQGNTSTVTVSVTGAKPEEKLQKINHQPYHHYIYANDATTLEDQHVSVYIPDNTFYDDVTVDFRVSGDTLHFHQDVIPLQKNIGINYDISQYQDGDKNKLFVGKITGYRKYINYIPTIKKGDLLTAYTKTLGKFILKADEKAPNVTPVNFQNGKWLSNYRYLKVKISDDLSGISSYRATVNDKFILMEYDYKTGLLTHDFNDMAVTDTRNELKIIVTDNVGNNTTFEATFLESKFYSRLKPYFTTIFLLVLLFPALLISQTATVKGVVLDEFQRPIPEVSIQSSTNDGTTTNSNGFYLLKIPSNQDIKITFKHISHKIIEITVNLKNGQDFEFNPVMLVNVEQIETVILKGNTRKNVEGVTSISPEILRTIKGAQPGVENILKTLPGVNISNELSTQYSVRGGNFDENLVYVNEIEVYRPFLIRSGNQEGLSFVNTDLVQNVDFSAGGFQAKYGDKISSVLDITYRTPVDFGVRADLSLLGGSIAVETISKDSKFSAITGIRYRDNSLLLGSLETEGAVEPVFMDAQAFMTYRFSDKFHLDFLGNASLNQYNFKPTNRQTNFGTLQNPIALLVFYDGQEKSQYQTLFGALKANYFVNDDLTLKLIASTYHTTEQEYFDILARYRLGEVNTNIGDENLGEVEFSEGIGSQLTHARNDLDALITTIQHNGDYKIDENSTVEWSLKYTHEDFRDRLVEWEVIDSAGFSIRPPNFNIPNNQPYEPFSGPLVAFQNIRATNFVQIDRVQASVQWSKRGYIGNHEVFYNAGVRAHNWTVSGVGLESNTQTVFSPRAQFAIKPNWNKDILFRVAGGLYYQPPFYRELRDSSGIVRPEVKAQQSFHVVLGIEHSFQMWDRPFKLVAEAYYKGLTDVNPYTLENVRIRYRARNNAEAYAYGLDMRLNGEFVPGTESWFSFGYLKTEENIDDRGYIARPTDQRLKFGVLFQDYVPNIPDLKMYLNLVYNTGVPGGSPSYADPYDFQFRLRDYRRADAGFLYDMVNAEKEYSNWKRHFKALSIGFEIYNIFNNQNSITNTWVRDVNSKAQFAIPNFLTPRVFNLRLTAQL